MPLPDVTGLSSNTSELQQAATTAISQEKSVLRRDRRSKVSALPESPYESSASSTLADESSSRFRVQTNTDLRFKLSAI